MSSNDFIDNDTVHELNQLLGRAAERGVDVQQALHSIAAGIGMMTAANVRDHAIADRFIGEFTDATRQYAIGARENWDADANPMPDTSAMERAAGDYDAAKAMTSAEKSFDKPLFDTMYAAMREAFDRGADPAAVLNTLTAHIGFMIGPNASNLKQRRLAVDNASQLIRGYAKAFADRHPSGNA